MTIGRKEYMKRWLQKNKEHRKKYHKQYNKQYYTKNKERIKEQHKQWRKKHPECMNQYKTKRRKTNLKCNLNNRIANAVWRSLKGNKRGGHWETLVGYTLNDLIKHLQKTMPTGYTWQDYLEGKLHIDHKIPISVFNFTDAKHIDFRRCWTLENLRLLPVEENLIKHNKLDRPFQSSLKI